MTLTVGVTGGTGFLEKISKTKFPLPFGLTDNKRSMVSVGVDYLYYR